MTKAETEGQNENQRGDEYGETITDATAESQDEALAVVQRLLTERGIRSHRHNTISLGLYGSHLDLPTWPNRPDSRTWMKRHPPELAVIGPQGWRDATVTVGSRSGCYLVSIRNGPDLQAVGQEQPEKVVDLILAARGT
ncbi:hypothetical protein ACFQVD_19200 [Streptosporangium amethystogenes subsp. fukuiense]|uniref:Uncharacterized protein n=1 Tax=Streptosporangium amethystogenes subsp. fukuiense TaxID=698418 RepID=A0ABW2T238_9ACTN